MGEKIRFIKESGTDYVCSQLPFETAAWLYSESTDSTGPAIPHALNPDVYVSQTTDKRGADIGFVGDLYERLIGDRERTDIVKFFERHGGKFGLHCDIRYDRLRRPDWVAFLKFSATA